MYMNGIEHAEEVSDVQRIPFFFEFCVAHILNFVSSDCISKSRFHCVFKDLCIHVLGYNKCISNMGMRSQSTIYRYCIVNYVADANLKKCEVTSAQAA